MSNPSPSRAASVNGTRVAAQRAAERRAERFEEARHLMAFGIHPDTMASQLRVSRASLTRQAYRYGAHDIAQYVSEVRLDRSHKHCVDCGDRVSPRAARCKPCFAMARRAA